MTRWNRVAIVGVGLIGGSIGLALRKRGLAAEVVGIGRSAESLGAALAAQAVTHTTCNLAEGVAGAQLVVICTPVGQIAEHVCQAATATGPDTLITDVGSTKLGIVRRVQQARRQTAWPRGVAFVGSHPIAGNEKRGPASAQADLFVDRMVVVTPTASTRSEHLEAVRGLWTSLGARVAELSAAEHDRILAVTSHLPHLVASAVAGATAKEYVTLTGGGWQDTTRIAAGDPALWQQIMLANRGPLLKALRGFRQSLGALAQALRRGDAAELERLLTEAKSVRDAVGS